MLVHAKSQHLVLNLRDPDRVLNIIPTARRVKVRGHELVAVPHRLDEVRVLRNLQIKPPSPIRHYYDWPGQYKPFKAQYETADFLTVNRNAFVLSDLGTGKSLSVLWAFDYLRSVGDLAKALIISPLSTLERTWADELFRHFPHLQAMVVHGTQKQRHKALAAYADVYIINHDGVKVHGIEEALAHRPDIDLVVIDEIAQVARNATAARWKALNRICNKQTPRRVWGLTGTPTPNAPTDAWAQARLVSPNNVPPYFNRFRDMVMRQQGPFTWVPRPNAAEVAYEALQPAVRFSRDDCVDLPPCIYQTRTVVMSPAQDKAYKQMVATLHAEIEAGTVYAVNEAVKASKLLQIACGAIYSTGDEVLEVDVSARVDVVREIVDEAQGKVIVFVPFVSAVHNVAESLRKSHGDAQVAVIYGEVSKHQRDQIFSAFQSNKAPRILVAQPAAMSHGLTLTEANTIVWYSALPSNEIYTQANGRITRPGQKNTQFIVHIEGSPIERRVFARLRNKQAMQGVLLDMVKTGVEAAPIVC